MTTKTTPAPKGLQTSGRKLWRDVAGRYELDAAEELQLVTLCRTADRLDAITTELAGQPLTIENAKGDSVVHPLVVEHRSLSIVFQRLVAGLRLPEAGTEARPQQRGGARGPYAVSPLRAAGA